MRRFAIFFALAVLVVAMLAGSAPVRAGDPAQEGLWLAAFAEDPQFATQVPDNAEESARTPTAVSLAVLPDGNVVFFNGVEDSESANISLAYQKPINEDSRTRRLDLSGYFSDGTLPGPAAFSTPAPESGGGGDLFCADLLHLYDGRVIAAGGTDWENEDEALGLPERLGRTELYGRRNTRIYDPATNEWSQAEHMAEGRWYPTAVTLADGRVFVAGGVGRLAYNSSAFPGHHPEEAGMLPQNVRLTETFDPDAGVKGEWTDNPASASISLPLFARLHLMPDGKILYDATGQMWSPFGEDTDQLGWNSHKLFDPASGTWTDAGAAPLGARSGSFSAVLPLEPPYDEVNVLIAGGTLGTTPGSYFSNNLSEILTWQAPGSISREVGPALNNTRWYSSGVVLPTGEVVALSGADRDEVVTPGYERPVRQAEMFDGTRWAPLAAGSRDRTYHNTAVLLKDGSILAGGHSPITNAYGAHANTGPGFASNFKDPSFEIFKPPYLFRGTRPAIQAAPDTLTRGVAFTVKTTDWNDATLKVVLSRLPATTHITDADQRTVDLPILARGEADGTVELGMPSSGAVLPPGYYYLFLVKTNAGQDGPTASVANIVKVNRTP